MGSTMRWSIILSALLSHCLAKEWGYAKDDDWQQLDGECGGKFQSPVDLIDVCDNKNNETVIVDKSLNLVFINYDREVDGDTLTLLNNGHTAQINVKGGDELHNGLPQLSGSAVGFNKFQLQQIHFHWNRNGSHSGTEHSLYGKKHAFEMHLVHFNTKYGAPDNAMEHPDGATVLSILFDYYDCEEEEGGMGEKCARNTAENMALAPITKQLREVDDADEKVSLSEPLNLRKLLPHDTKTFFWYQGSLTTPPCAEDLTWIVFPEIQNISKRQLKSFEFNFKNDDGKVLGTTNRGLQPLNGRLLLISRDDHCRGESAVPADQESDDFAESTNIEIGAQQTVADFGDDDEGGDDDHNDRHDDADKKSEKIDQEEKNDSDRGRKDRSKGKGDNSNGGKDDSNDESEDKKEKTSSYDESSKDNKSSGKDDRKESDSSDESDRDDKKSGNKESSSRSSNSSDTSSKSKVSKRGTGHPAGRPTGGPPGDATGANDPNDNGGVLSNAAGVNRPYGLYGDKPAAWRRKRQTGDPAGPPTGDPPGDAKGDNDPNDNGGVLSNAAGVNRPYGLYGDKPAAQRRKQATGHPAGPPTGNPAGGPTSA